VRLVFKAESANTGQYKL